MRFRVRQLQSHIERDTEREKERDRQTDKDRDRIEIQGQTTVKCNLLSVT